MSTPPKRNRKREYAWKSSLSNEGPTIKNAVLATSMLYLSVVAGEVYMCFGLEAVSDAVQTAVRDMRTLHMNALSAQFNLLRNTAMTGNYANLGDIGNLTNLLKGGLNSSTIGTTLGALGLSDVCEYRLFLCLCLEGYSSLVLLH